ncbi:MAG: lycopene cyclase domain-containing protein [Candidatus Roizmanbacteria bacterium]
MKIEYLVFNYLIVIFPLITTVLLKKVRLPHLRPATVAIAISALLFIIFDNLVTGYFWVFNPAYILGIQIGNIPIEEALFFFTVPFSCLFLWANWKRRFGRDSSAITHIPSVLLAISLLGGINLFFVGKYYTASVFMMMFVTVLIDMYFKSKLFIRSYFLWYLCIINAFTFVFNLYLTARPIVIYNLGYKSGMMVYSIPIEDFVFGIALISLTILIYERISLHPSISNN